MKRECPRNANSGGAPVSAAASAPGKHFERQLATEAQGQKAIDDEFEQVISSIMGENTNDSNVFFICVPYYNEPFNN